MCVNLQNMEETAEFSGKIYTADKNFTQPPIAAVTTNFNSVAKFIMEGVGVNQLSACT